MKGSINLRRYGWTLIMFLTCQFLWAPSGVALMAQEPPEGSSEFEETEQNSNSPIANGPPELPQNQQSASEENSPRRGEFVIAPLPISSPALGTGIVPIVGYIFHLSKRDQISPSSVMGGSRPGYRRRQQSICIGREFLLQRRPLSRGCYICSW